MTLALVALAAFASMASMRVCDPMLIALGREFQVSTGDASAVVSAFAVAYGLSQLFYGPLGDRIGKLRVVVAATAACALASAVTAMASTLPWLVASRVAMGAAAAGIVPLAIAWIGDHVAYENRQETLARFAGATLTGMMAGQWFGGFAVQSLGWRSAFSVLAVLFAVAAVLLHFQTRALALAGRFAPARPVPLARYFGNSLALLGEPPVRRVLAMTAIEGALASGALAFIPSRLMDRFQYSPAEAGAAMVLFGVGGLLYSQLARRWLSLLGEGGIARCGGALLAIALLILAWADHARAGAGACLVAGMGLYMLHNTLQTLATQMAPAHRGSAISMFACVLFLFQSMGVWSIAASLDSGLLATSFSLAAIGLVLLGVWVARHVRPRPAAPVA